MAARVASVPAAAAPAAAAAAPAAVLVSPPTAAALPAALTVSAAAMLLARPDAGVEAAGGGGAGGKICPAAVSFATRGVFGADRDEAERRSVGKTFNMIDLVHLGQTSFHKCY